MKIDKLCGILIFLFAFGTGQGIGQSQKISGSMGFYLPGIQLFAPSDLNSHFPEKYPEMSFSNFSHAGSAFSIMKNFVFGWQGGGFDGGPYIKDDIQIDLTGSYSSFLAGYVVYSQKKFFAYPLIGLSWNSLEFYIHQPDQVMPFTNLLVDPNQATTLIYKSLNLDISMGFNYFLSGQSAENGLGGLLLGLELGYQLPGFRGKWSFDNGSIEGAPAFNMDGFFFRILIGGGSIVKQ